MPFNIYINKQKFIAEDSTSDSRIVFKFSKPDAAIDFTKSYPNGMIANFELPNGRQEMMIDTKEVEILNDITYLYINCHTISIYEKLENQIKIIKDYEDFQECLKNMAIYELIKIPYLIPNLKEDKKYSPGDIISFDKRTYKVDKDFVYNGVNTPDKTPEYYTDIESLI